MFALLTSCDSETTPAGPASSAGPASPVQPDAAAGGMGPSEVAALETVARLTPEQLSQAFVSALGTDYGADLGDGSFLSYVTTDLAVPLGGVDFLGRVRDRDPLTKVQTLLVSRGIAWPLAIKLVQSEVDAPGAAGSLFTRCRFSDDHPAGNDDARTRWEAQLQDFYLRLLSRPATTEEVALVAATFERVYTREQNTASAWLVTLYALISSMEVWHTWR